MGLFRNSRELQFGTCKLRQNHRQIQRRKRETLFYKAKGKLEGAVINRIYCRKLGVRSVVGFHWRVMTVSHWLGLSEMPGTSLPIWGNH